MTHSNKSFPGVVSAQSGPDNDEVTITATNGGTVVQCSSQVHNYQFRAPSLAHLSVWNFISSMDKVTNLVSREFSHDVVIDGEEDGETSNEDENIDDVEEHEIPTVMINLSILSRHVKAELHRHSSFI